MDDVLILINDTSARDATGIFRKSVVRRQVMCQISSISRQEFFEAGRNGLNPEMQFSIFAGDYKGERTCEYHGRGYGIYRTYIVPGSDYIELYAERKGGTNGENDTDRQDGCRTGATPY